MLYPINNVYETITLLKGQMVYILTEDETCIDYASHEFGIYESIEKLNDNLSEIDTSSKEVRTVCGFITTAEVIPEKLIGVSGNLCVFLLVVDPDDEESAVVSEVDGDVESVSSEIEKIVKAKKFGKMEDVTIDNIFIVYGSEIELHLAAREDDIDEEVTAACKSIAEEVSKLQSQNKKELEEQKKNSIVSKDVEDILNEG